MKGHRQQRIAAALAAAVVASLLIGTPASAAPPISLDANPDNRAAATQLSKDNGLPLHEAQRRVARQDQQIALADQLRHSLGAGFGGAWIDHDNAGRLTVAIVGASTAASVREAAATKRLTDTTSVVVQPSYTDLEKISTALGARLAAANKGVQHGLQAAIDVKHNTVRLDLPKGKNLTDTQHDAIRWVSQQFGNGVSSASTTSHRCRDTAAASTTATRHYAPAWPPTWAADDAPPHS